MSVKKQHSEGGGWILFLWKTFHSDTLRNFPKPDTSRLARIVINHFGDELRKVFEV